MNQRFILFAGTANPQLAAGISAELGAALGARSIGRFPDGEICVRLDEPVRGGDVFIIQPTSPPVDEHLMELLAFADACRRASAAHITAVVPYFGYARSDKRSGREPIMASVVSGLMQSAGIEHLVVVDVHVPQLEGFFHIAVDSLTAVPAVCDALRPHWPAGAAIVAPDAGRVKMAGDYAHRLGGPVIVLHKQRESGTETKVIHVVGDVRDRPCLIIDDMVATGSTLCGAIQALRAAGAQERFTVAATHALLLPGAREKLLGQVDAMYVTDTVAPPLESWPGLRIVSVAPLLAGVLRKLVGDGALQDLSPERFVLHD